MSTFGTPSAGSRVLRANAPRTRLTGITETLNTPGLAVPPPVSAGANTAAQLLSLIEQVGGTANAMNAYVQQGQADERRRQAEAEQAEADRQRAEREAATVMRGKAELDKPAILAKYGALIQSGKLSVPSDYNAFINKIVQEEAGGETNPDYINQLRKSIGEGLAGEFQQQQVQQARAADAQIEAAHSAAAFANPADVQTVIADRKRLYPNQTEAQQLSPILAAAQRKAEIGSEDYKTLAAALPDSIFGIAKDELRAKYETAKTRFATAKTRAAEDVIGQYRYGGNYPGALAALQGFVDQGVIDGEKANTIKKGIEEEQKAKLNQSFEAQFEAAKQGIISGFTSQVGQALDAGVAFAVRDLKAKLPGPDGKEREVNLSVKEAIDSEMQKRLAPDGGFPALTQANIELASSRDYTVPQWKGLFETAASSLGQYSLSVRDGKVTDQPTANVLSAFEAYKQMLSMGKDAYASRLADPKTIEKFRVAARAQQQANGVGGGNAVSSTQALLSAIQVVDAPSKVDDKILRNAIVDLAPNFLNRWFAGGKEVENIGEMMATLSPLVAIKSKSSQDPEKAVEETIKEYRDRIVPINGYYHLAQPDLPSGMKSNITKMFDQIADEYVEKYGKSKGVTKEQLTLRPDPNAQVWHLVIKGNPGVAFTDSIDDVTFTYTDLGKAYGRWSEAQRKRILSAPSITAQDIASFGVTP